MVPTSPERDGGGSGCRTYWEELLFLTSLFYTFGLFWSYVIDARHGNYGYMKTEGLVAYPPISGTLLVGVPPPVRLPFILSFITPLCHAVKAFKD